jgi:hypothetical protein
MALMPMLVDSTFSTSLIVWAAQIDSMSIC